MPAVHATWGLRTTTCHALPRPFPAGSCRPCAARLSGRLPRAPARRAAGLGIARVARARLLHHRHARPSLWSTQTNSGSIRAREGENGHYRFGLRDLGVCGCVPGEGAGDRQSSQKARSRVRSGGLTVATHAWAKWMQQMAASGARGAPSSLGIRRRPLGLGEGVSEVGGGIAAFGRPGGGERRPGALPRGLGWGGEGRSLRGAGRGRGRRDCGRLIVAVGAAVAGVAGG